MEVENYFTFAGVALLEGRIVLSSIAKNNSSCEHPAFIGVKQNTLKGWVSLY